MIEVASIINGRHVTSDKRFQTINPATLEPVANVYSATEDQVREAIDNSQKAYEGWKNINIINRAEFLKRTADLIDQQRNEIATLITTEEGKVYSEAYNEVNNAYKVLYYYYGEARRTTSLMVKSEQDNVFAGTIRVPLGIVFVLTPFNSPFSIPFWNIAPALLHGNTVIFKPSSVTSAIGQKIAELFQEAGLPPGVMNILHGNADMISNTVLNDDRCKLLAFTGSREVGEKLSLLNGKYMRRQILELGGKNAAIVLADADLNLAVSSLVFASFSNSGQRCTAASRILIDKKVYDEFIEKFTKKAKGIKIGNGIEKETRMGPVASLKQYRTVTYFIRDGVNRGIKLRTGRAEYPMKPTGGYFIEPTIFSEVDKMDKLAQEEIFGPVVSLIPVSDLNEAIDVANSTNYGLVSAIYTKDLQAAFRAIDEIDTGVTFVNQGPTGIEYSLPYLGSRKSGYGEELGLTSINNYTRTKSIYVDYSYSKRPFFW